MRIKGDIFTLIWVPSFKDRIKLVISCHIVYNDNSDKEENIKQA